MRKKLLTIFVLLFSIFLFCGCATANYSVAISSDGKVTMQFSFKIDKTIFNSTAEEHNFKSRVNYVANQVVQNMYDNFEQKVAEVAENGIVETYTMNENGKYEMTVQEVITYTELNIQPIGKRPQIIWDSKNNVIYCTISISFSNIYAYRYFNGIFPQTEDEVDEDVVETRQDNLFYVEDRTYQNCVFNDIENNSIAQYFVEYFGDAFSVDDVTYSFTYSTPSSKLYSDADSVYEDDNGNYVHTWKFDNQKLKQDGQSKICTYTVKVRTWVWYVCAIVLSLIVFVVLSALSKINAKRHSNVEQATNNTNIDSGNIDILSQPNDIFDNTESNSYKKDIDENI